MAVVAFGKCVFVNCPFDERFEPLLRAIVFCIVRFGLKPRLATERLEAGESRLAKIIELMRASKFSIHDLSRCEALEKGETLRMNMPFEYGLDYGLRNSGNRKLAGKQFLIFEASRFDLKRALSDTAGHDVFAHECNHEKIIRHMRDFFRSEAGLELPGPSQLQREYATCQGWIVEKMIQRGHSEQESLQLPTREIVDAMEEWMVLGMPT